MTKKNDQSILNHQLSHTSCIQFLKKKDRYDYNK